MSRPTLPPWSTVVALTFIVFGLEALLFAVVTLGSSAAFVSSFLNYVSSIVTLPTTVSTGLTLLVASSWILAVALYTLLYHKFIFPTPRGLSLPIVLVVFTIVTLILHFTDVSPVIAFIRDNVINPVVKFLIDTFGAVVPWVFASLCVVYAIFVPLLASAIEKLRLTLPATSVVTIVVSGMVSLITIQLTIEATRYITPVSNVLLSLALLITALIGIEEIRKALIEKPAPSTLMQIPAVLAIVKLGMGALPIIAQALTVLLVALVIIVSMFIIIGLGLGRASYLISACSVIGAFALGV